MRSIRCQYSVADAGYVNMQALVSYVESHDRTNMDYGGNAMQIVENR